MQERNQKIAEQLKQLNASKGPVSLEFLNYHRKNTANQKKVLDAIKEKEKTAPEISAEISLPSWEVLRQLTGLVKYGKAEVIFAKTGYLKYKAK